MSTRKNAAYNIAYRVFSVLLPLVTMPYLTRVCGQDGVGLYSYAWTISEFFCLAAMLGLNDYGVRAVAQVRDDREKLDRTFSAIWQMQLIVAGVTLVFWLGYKVSQLPAVPKGVAEIIILTGAVLFIVGLLVFIFKVVFKRKRRHKEAGKHDVQDKPEENKGE